MRPPLALAAAALALAAFPAWAQAPAKDIFKGRIKEGLYEIRTDVDMSGVPGVGKDVARQSQTTQRCVTKAEVDQGIASDKNCPIRNHTVSGNTIQFAADCRDGSKTDMRMTFSDKGYEAEMKSAGTQAGKPYQSVIRTQSRYLGACPAGKK